MNRIALVLIVIGLITGGWRWNLARKAPKEITRWEPYTVEVGRLKEAIPCDGTLEPRRKTELKSRAAGEIRELHVVEGQPIEAGTIIAQLETEELVQNVRQAEANLQAARAQLSLAVRGFSPSEKANRQTRLAEAEIALKQAQREFDRVKGLHEQGFSSQRELDNARTSLELAQSNVDLARSLLQTLEAGGQPEEREAARAAIVRNEAILATAREQLANATVTAPVSGTILYLPVEVGTTVSSGISANTGGTVIAVIGDLDTLLLEGTVDESDIGRVTLGMPCEVTTDAYPSLLFKGTVEQIAPQAQLAQNVSTFRVRIKVDLDNPQQLQGRGRSQFRGTFAGMGGGGGGNAARKTGGQRKTGGGGGAAGAPGGQGRDLGAPPPAPAPTLRAGMTATAEIIISSFDEAPVIPLRFLQFDDTGRAYVWRWPSGVEPPDPEDLDSSRKTNGAGPQPEAAYVEIAYTDGVSYAIQAGIQPGDVIVAEEKVEMETKWGAFGMRSVPKGSSGAMGRRR